MILAYILSPHRLRELTPPYEVESLSGRRGTCDIKVEFFRARVRCLGDLRDLIVCLIVFYCYFGVFVFFNGWFNGWFQIDDHFASVAVGGSVLGRVGSGGE